MKRLVFLLAACGSPAKPPAPPVAVVEVDVDVDVDPPEPDVVGREGDDDFDVVVVEVDTERTLLDEAKRILSATKTSTYQHKTKVDEATGHFAFDCSGFVGYALERSQPRAMKALRESTVKRPLAKHFVTYFQTLTTDSSPWRTVKRVDELEPGDVIAWLKPDDVVTKNTGHVMIVHGTPRRGPDGTISVPIIDSTGVPHGKGDSRKKRKLTGVGTGEVLLVVDDDGAPIAYRWSRGKKATVHTTTIALARVAP